MINKSANNYLNADNIATDFLLLLTATIDIKGMPKAYPSVPEQRENDYFNSLKYYITEQPRIKKILFVENSGWNLDRLKSVVLENPHRKQVEFISLDCNDFPRQFGKGYGETLLIERGILQSSLVKEVNYIGKITGRIYLLNMTRLLESVKQPYDCLCDFKEPIFKRLTGHRDTPDYADTRFIVFHKDFYYRYLQPMHHEHRTGCFYSEHKYYHAIKEASSSARVLKRFPIEPRFAGIAGHFQGKNYSSKKEMVKFGIRSLSRSLIPWVYL